jgi:hypothetical protein
MILLQRHWSPRKCRKPLSIRPLAFESGPFHQEGTFHVPRTSYVRRGGGKPRRKRLHLLRPSVVWVSSTVLAVMCSGVQSTVLCALRRTLRRAMHTVLQLGRLRAHHRRTHSALAGSCARDNGPNAGPLATAAHTCAAVHANALHSVRVIPPQRVMREKKRAACASQDGPRAASFLLPSN